MLLECPGHRLASRFIALAVLVFTTPLLPGEVPPRTLAGQSLEVPDEMLDEGKVFYVSPGQDTQLTIVSRTPLKRSVATTSRVVGFVVAPWDLDEVVEKQAKVLLTGAFRIPVYCLSVGSASEDLLLRSEPFLDLTRYPEMTLEIVEAGPATRRAASENQTSYELEVKVRLQLKEWTRVLTLPARVSFLPFSSWSMGRNVGDFLSLETQLEIDLDEAGIGADARQADLVANTVSIDVFLMMNTISPDKSLNPNADPALHHKRLHFLTLLRDLGDGDAAYTYAAQIVPEFWDDAPQLAWMARMMAFGDGVVIHDWDFAARLASRTVELSEGRDPGALQMLAEIYYLSARFEKAVEFQKKTVELLSADPKRKAQAERVLKKYESSRARTF